MVTAEEGILDLQNVGEGLEGVFSVSIEQSLMDGMEFYLPYSPTCGSSIIFLYSVIKCPNVFWVAEAHLLFPGRGILGFFVASSGCGQRIV